MEDLSWSFVYLDQTLNHSVLEQKIPTFMIKALGKTHLTQFVSKQSSTIKGNQKHFKNKQTNILVFWVSIIKIFSIYFGLACKVLYIINKILLLHILDRTGGWDGGGLKYTLPYLELFVVYPAKKWHFLRLNFCVFK